MKLKIKKTLSLLLAFIMLMSGGVTGQAAETLKTTENVTTSNSDVFNEAEFIASAVRTELVEEKRTENSDTYRLSNGQYECVVYADNKYYKGDNGKYLEIDNAVVRAGSSKEIQGVKSAVAIPKEYAYTNASNDVKTYFTHGTTPSVMLEYKGKAIEFAPMQAQKANLVIAAMSSVKALKNITNVSDNSVTYHDVYTDTDLTYVVANSAVKEYITLNSKNAPTAFAFTFKLNGLTAEAVEGGTVAFKDGDKTVFELGSLFAIDANEAYTDELEYTIIKNTGDVAIIGVSLSTEPTR